MQLRKRLLLSFVVTVLIVGSAVVVWASKTGRFTIFGDQALLVTADLAVTNQLDLAKGVAAGDNQLIETANGIELAPDSRSGNAIFTVGERDIEKLYRVIPVISTLPSGTTISLKFAGSIDGIAFNDYSPPQSIVVNATNQVEPVALDFLIPSDSRFVRIKVILERTVGDISPTFGGFTLSYGAPIPSNGTIDQTKESILVNGTGIDRAAGALPPTPGKPDSLVVTGTEPWVYGLTFLWLIAVTIIFTRRDRSIVRGARGSRSSPDH